MQASREAATQGSSGEDEKASATPLQSLSLVPSREEDKKVYTFDTQSVGSQPPSRLARYLRDSQQQQEEVTKAVFGMVESHADEVELQGVKIEEVEALAQDNKAGISHLSRRIDNLQAHRHQKEQQPHYTPSLPPSISFFVGREAVSKAL
ncbi:MAG: hypothetical protein AAFQ78_01495, partial [Bacteroidota bacterium]